MNSTSETTPYELRIASAYLKLSCIPLESSGASVSLASIGTCEIRMFREQKADLDGAPLFWLELLDRGTSVDSFRCHDLKDAAPVFEYLLSQAAHLNKSGTGDAESTAE